MSKVLLTWTDFCAWVAGRRVAQEIHINDDACVVLTFEDGARATIASDQTDATSGWSEVTPGSDGHLLPPWVTVEEGESEP